MGYIGINMTITVIICDECERGNNDGVVVTKYRINQGVKPCLFMEDEYLIDWQYVDLCKDCFPKVAKDMEES